MAYSNLERLTVLGAGVLGGQIAWHSSFKGKTVVVYDPFPRPWQRPKLPTRRMTESTGASSAPMTRP